MAWEPDDTFYEGYSLWEDFGYGPPGEVARARKELSFLGYQASNDATKEFLELTRELYGFVRVECQQEVSKYQAASKKLVVAGGSPPFDVALAFAIAKLIIGAASVAFSAAKASASILDYLRRKNPTGFEQPEILERAVKKLLAKKNVRDLIVERTERWRISYPQTKGDGIRKGRKRTS